MLSGFKKFILRGNAIDLAVGVVIGAAFNSLVSSIVMGLISPLVAAIFKAPDFSYMAFTINGSHFNYGLAINSLISFLLVAFTVYFLVVLPLNKLMAKFKKEPEAIPTTKICPECASAIPHAAKRCPLCTSVLENK